MTILKTNKLAGPGGTNAIDGSVFFSDTNDRLSVPNSADVRVGSDDFTIEAWIRAENPGDFATVIGMWDSSATRRTYALQRKKSDSKLYFYVSADGGSTISATNTQYAYGGDVTLGDWHHVAGVRDGNTIRAYLNGVEVGNASFTASILNNTTDALFIGDTEVTAGGEAFNGYMSNVRMVKGTCLYPSGTTFTPPTEKLTAIDGTVLLCCQDSDDPTQEATGKTITGYGNLDYSLVGNNLITNGNFDSSATDSWTASLGSGSAALGTGQSGTFGDGNHLVLTGSGGYAQLSQSFTTVVGRTYFVNAQSNGGDASFISTSASTGDAIITDIRSSPQTGNGVRGQKSFVATTTTYYVILRGNDGSAGNFDTVSVYEAEPPKAPKVVPPVGTDAGTVLEGGVTFDSLNYMTLPKGTTTQANRGRGLLGGSNDGSPFSDNIQYINIQSQGNSVDFGNLSEARSRASSYASSTRGIWGGGSSAPTSKTDRIDYVTIATTASAIDFGNLTLSRRFCSGTSSATRGLTAGGNEASPSSPYPSVNVIDYTTIASAGDATNFGDLLAGARSGPGALSSPTRALFAGGYSHGSPAGATNDIDYVTIATLGDAVDFGDLSVTKRYLAGVSNNTRGVFGSGSNPGAKNIIDYVTIATTGVATDFGDNTIANEHRAGISNSIRGVWAGSGSPAIGNTIDFVIIATTGNATDFGDTATNMGYTAGCSDSHGGLS